MSELFMGFVATAELEHTKAADVVHKAAEVVAEDREKDE